MARGGGEEGGGLEVCGRRLAVGDVSNSDEGTGLFTWVREGAGASFSCFCDLGCGGGVWWCW